MTPEGERLARARCDRRPACCPRGARWRRFRIAIREPELLLLRPPPRRRWTTSRSSTTGASLTRRRSTALFEHHPAGRCRPALARSARDLGGSGSLRPIASTHPNASLPNANGGETLRHTRSGGVFHVRFASIVSATALAAALAPLPALAQQTCPHNGRRRGGADRPGRALRPGRRRSPSSWRSATSTRRAALAGCKLVIDHARLAEPGLRRGRPGAPARRPEARCRRSSAASSRRCRSRSLTSVTGAGRRGADLAGLLVADADPARAATARPTASSSAPSPRTRCRARPRRSTRWTRA